VLSRALADRTGMTGYGASRPLAIVPAKVSSANRKPALDLDAGDYSSCPKAASDTGSVIDGRAMTPAGNNYRAGINFGGSSFACRHIVGLNMKSPGSNAPIFTFASSN
jgi:hypothetical protein